MEGVEAVRHIRALAGGREVKIAAVSASVFAGQQGEVLAAGLDDFVRKPYRPGEIFECMARHLGVRYSYLEAWPASRVEAAAALPHEAFATLPAELRTELREALIALRVERIEETIHRVRERDSTPWGGPGALCRPIGVYGDLAWRWKAARRESTGESQRC